METNKNNINECLEEFDKEMKTNFGSLKHQVCNRDMKIEDIIEFSKNFLKQKLQQVEEHETENGYCCACEYDIACMNEKIEIAVQKKVEEIKKSKTKIVGILFNAQNSPIEYSLQEIADKIIKIIKN